MSKAFKCDNCKNLVEHAKDSRTIKMSNHKAFFIDFQEIFIETNFYDDVTENISNIDLCLDCQIKLLKEATEVLEDIKKNGEN